MPEYGPCAIRYTSPTPLAVVYDRLESNNQGHVASTQYWNHASEGWEAAPMDPAKHLLPLQRLATEGPFKEVYIFFVPTGMKSPFSSPNATASVFKLDDLGAPTAECVDVVTRTTAQLLAGTL